ncbi:MAG: NAD(P)-dependent glycerol-3-phosphate dehydrogenase [Thiotrichaceae bacterium]|nr:NAD(P)-dependent glycerol-3-phosphate dehydrogenase [Thiotrichaceae bacterium]
MLNKIAVYGAGSWGTALAILLARNGLQVLLWDMSAEQAERINTARENKQYIPDTILPDNLCVTANLDDMLAFSRCQLIVVPSHGFRSLLNRMQDGVTADHSIFWASKGIEVDSGMLLHEIMQEILPNNHYGVVSGPTFALEVAKGLPTAMTVAGNSLQSSQALSQALQGNNVRIYTSTDVIGVELGGAVKNVLAIAAGIADGLGFGANARAALITRGLTETRRLAKVLGAQDETLMGLAGLGDLVLTCTDNQSRNRRLGLALGLGKTIEQAQEEIGQAIEGLKTSQSVKLLAQRAGVEMPICDLVYKILYQQLPPQQAVETLLSRQQKAEASDIAKVI